MSRLRLAPIRPRDVEPHWRALAETIGERRAGSAAEHRAARYIQEAYRQAGVDGAWLEPFTCHSLVRAKTFLQIKDGARWKRAPCEALVNSPSTKPPGRPVERPLVWIEMPEQAARLKPGSMKGKALGLFGPLSTDTRGHRALVRSGAALVLWVDDRLPFEWPKADAVLPLWVKRHGALPTVAVSFREAYAWRANGVRRVRAFVRTEHQTARSYNVVGELSGRGPRAGIVTLGCHYDTQVGNPGADDNASGCVAAIALARAFAKAARQRPFRHTLRFVAFGTEEQLSVGARAYAEAHREEMKTHLLMLNFDSLSSALGHSGMLVAGSPSLERWALRGMNRAGVALRVSHEVTPFADHFPFTALGVPALWFHRLNFPGGRWQHHSPHDTLATVHPEVLCTFANAAAKLAAQAADARQRPFRGGIPPAQRPTIRRFARELFDLYV